MTKRQASVHARDAPESAEHPLRRARHALPGASVFAFFRTAFPDACGPGSSPAMPFFGLCGRASGRAGHLFARAAEVRMRAGQGVSFRGRRPKRRRRVSICRKHRLPGRRRRLFQRPDNALRPEFMTERWQRGAEAAERGKTYAVVKMPFGGRRNRRRPW